MIQFLRMDKNQILEEESDKFSSNSQSRFQSASMKPLDTLSNHSLGSDGIIRNGASSRKKENRRSRLNYLNINYEFLDSCKRSPNLLDRNNNYNSNQNS